LWVTATDGLLQGFVAQPHLHVHVVGLLEVVEVLWLALQVHSIVSSTNKQHSLSVEETVEGSGFVEMQHALAQVGLTATSSIDLDKHKFVQYYCTLVTDCIASWTTPYWKFFEMSRDDVIVAVMKMS
jgi:hypothetical protein